MTPEVVKGIKPSRVDRFLAWCDRLNEALGLVSSYPFEVEFGGRMVYFDQFDYAGGPEIELRLPNGAIFPVNSKSVIHELTPDGNLVRQFWAYRPKGEFQVVTNRLNTSS